MDRGDRREDIFLDDVDRQDVVNETTLPLKEIAARAHLGSAKSASARLHRWMKQPRHPIRPRLGCSYERK
jgi:hypothetical protein